MRGRERYAVTFMVVEYWRGKPARTIKLYELEPLADCLGAGYQVGRNYLVFASQRIAEERQLDSDFFWYGWTDVLPLGTTIFQTIACTPSGEIS